MKRLVNTYVESFASDEGTADFNQEVYDTLRDELGITLERCEGLCYWGGSKYTAELSEVSYGFYEIKLWEEV